MIARVLLQTWLLGCACLISADGNAQTKPNVIFIMIDDAGYGDIGSYGGTDIATPNLDQLAAQGVRFTDFYSNGPVCSATRAGFMTGRYQSRVGIDNPLGGNNRDGLPATVITFPQMLSGNGYATALIGKWHLGTAGDELPNAHGFGYFYGIREGYADYYEHTGESGAADLWENETQITEAGYLTDLITGRSVSYIAETASEQPFFLSVQYTAPHWPFQPPGGPSVPDSGSAGQLGFAMPGTRADYVQMVERIDVGVGEILRALDDAGVAENTLVIFTNDNGGERLSRNDPLFHRKGTVWEGGIRVPAIFRWPGRIRAGSVTHQVGITMDVTATILAATDTPVPANVDLDGIDLLPVLAGETAEMQRTLFWRALYNSERAVRSGDWKLVKAGINVFLFDLSTDIGERNDLAMHRQGIVAELLSQLAVWDAEVDAEAIARGFSVDESWTTGP